MSPMSPMSPKWGSHHLPSFYTFFRARFDVTLAIVVRY